MQITGKKTQLKEFISLIILFIILNCSSRQTLLISHGNKPFSQFDWKIEEGLPFQYTPDKEEDGWNSFKRKVNFFRSHLWIWMDDYYEDYEFDVYGIKYYKIYACLKFYQGESKPNYLQEIFKPYIEKISNLNNITIILREVLIHSTIMSAPTSHCLILTGMISDVRN